MTLQPAKGPRRLLHGQAGGGHHLIEQAHGATRRDLGQDRVESREPEARLVGACHRRQVKSFLLERQAHSREHTGHRLVDQTEAQRGKSLVQKGAYVGADVPAGAAGFDVDDDDRMVR